MRAMIRGYRILRGSEGQIPELQDLHRRLRRKSLEIAPGQFSREMLGAAIPSAELILRQALATREHTINRELLISIAKSNCTVALPLPKSQLATIEGYGFKIDYLKSTLYLGMTELLNLVRGCIQIAANLIDFLHNTDETINIKPYVYFVDLSLSNLPQGGERTKSYCIVNWYINWSGRNKELTTIRHSVKQYPNGSIANLKLEYVRSPFSIYMNLEARLKYLTWSLKAVALSTFDLLRGRWWHAMLLREAANAAIVRFSDRKQLARQYFFHNSRFYPPLWCYELPAVQSEAIVYWYSTNSIPFRRADGSRPFTTPYSLMNWPRHLAWSDVQENFIKRCAKKNPTIEIVGPIWFQDSGETLKDISEPVIAVFDVQPVRQSLYCLLAPAVDYYTVQTLVAFYSDIIDVFNEGCYSLLIKRKRSLGKLVHPTYANFFKSIIRLNRVFEANSGIAAHRIIEGADAVISLPFTSTALIAASLGKPTIFYDPTCTLSTKDFATNGVPLLIGKKALGEWSSTLVTKKMLV